MDRQPVDHPPDKWRGELEGLYIKHDGDIPVTVKVTRTDGTEGEVNAWTGQWTRTHVCVSRETAPPYHPFWYEPRTSGGGRTKAGHLLPGCRRLVPS